MWSEWLNLIWIGSTHTCTCISCPLVIGSLRTDVDTKSEQNHWRAETSRIIQTSVPLCLFVKHPELQVELQLSTFLFSFLDCCQPVSRGIKSRLDHLKLLQARLVNILLLHDVQLWERWWQQCLWEACGSEWECLDLLSLAGNYTKYPHFCYSRCWNRTARQ